MPIGKNAIKRVTNNGYSNTKTVAPDMENSVVVEKELSPAEAKPTVKKSSAKKTSTTAKKTTTKKAPAPKKSMEVEPELSPVKTLEKVTKEPSEAPKRRGDGYINLGGGDLPYYLL